MTNVTLPSATSGREVLHPAQPKERGRLAPRGHPTPRCETRGDLHGLLDDAVRRGGTPRKWGDAARAGFLIRAMPPPTLSLTGADGSAVPEAAVRELIAQACPAKDYFHMLHITCEREA